MSTQSRTSQLTGDVLEMSAVLEPRSTCTNVVRCCKATIKSSNIDPENGSLTALALDLDQHGEITGRLAIPSLEGL